MVIESGNVRFEHNAPERKNNFTDKQVTAISVLFSVCLCGIIVASVYGITTLCDGILKIDNTFLEVLIGFVFAIVLIAFIGVSFCIFIRIMCGDTNQMNANTVVGYMTGPDFEVGFFKGDLLLKRTFADNSVSYNPLSEILNKMFWCMEDVEIDGDVDSTKPIRLDVNVDFSEKQVRAVISNI